MFTRVNWPSTGWVRRRVIEPQKTKISRFTSCITVSQASWIFFSFFFSLHFPFSLFIFSCFTFFFFFFLGMANNHNPKRQDQPREGRATPHSGGHKAIPPQNGRTKPHSQKEEATTTTRRARTKPREGRTSPHAKMERPSHNPRGKVQPHRKNLSKPMREVSANSNPKKGQPPTPRRNGLQLTDERSGSSHDLRKMRSPDDLFHNRGACKSMNR